MVFRAFQFGLCLMLLAPGACRGGEVRIGVFGLFHPVDLTVSAAPGPSLRITADGWRWMLRDGQTCQLRWVAGRVRLTAGGRQSLGESVLAAGPGGEPTDFTLGVPGKISRRFHGRLEVVAAHGELVPVVTMDLETAVASAVAAESPAAAPLEALKAQAVATRSYYLAARHRHQGFDFCDTTHCQFLRAPPPGASAAAHATLATRGVVLRFRGEIVPALFTGSCGGRTRTLAEVGLAESGGYPFYAVECPYCRKHALDWSVELSRTDAAGLASGWERDRLRLGRRLGWNIVPGNDFVLVNAGSRVLVRGRGKGHGVGLCQLGATGMAAGGSLFTTILDTYFPNTTLGNWPP
jgi:stage II sporulation protein D (peptidoglycan lytic transglycosylase)